MKLRSFRVAATLAALASTSACAYYNSMYNANRLFAEAEKAAARGDLGTARTAYHNSIEKATTSVQRHPDSKWSDDARLLMARAHLQLGDPVAARQQLLALLSESPDAQRRVAAEVYLGIIAAELGDDGQALARLSGALEPAPRDAQLRAAGHLARAHIHYRAQNWSSARADVKTARAAGVDMIRLRATLLDLRIALAQRDSVQAAEAWSLLLRDPAAQNWTDSLPVLVRATASAFAPGFAQARLAPAASAPWRAGARDSLLMLRSALLLQSGDTAAALADLERIAARASGTMADAARVHTAEWRLAGTSRLDQLGDIRATLLPALGDMRARSLVQSLKTLDVLTERARDTGQPLALFAAAELARDELHAPLLAAQLFLAYAELAPQTQWAAKALLAASALDPARSAEFRRQAERYDSNPYIAVLNGRSDSDASYQQAEEGLARTLQALVTEATTVASRRELTVNRAVTTMDSLRLVARTDSTRVSCGIMLDSLAVAGIRADSIRAACMRGDRPRIALLLKADTLMLRDSTKALADSLARARGIRRDTTRTR